MKITERGWGAHFICGARCRFRRNTLIEGPGGKVIVSTVGNMEDRSDGAIIGCIGVGSHGTKRFYETSVFETAMDGPYRDIDVEKQRSDYQGKWAIYAKKPKNLPADVDIQANKMHEATVKFYVKLLSKKR